MRKLTRDLGLADAGRTRRTDSSRSASRASRRPARASLIAEVSADDRAVLAVDDALQRLVEMLQHLGIVLRNGLGRNARHRGDRRLDLLDADRLLAPRFRQQHLPRAGLVDHVDRLVRQLAVVDVARRKFHRRLHGLVGVADLVELLEIGLQPLHDLDGVGNRGLVDVDLLEAAHQRAILLEILPVFLVGRRADAAQRALRQRGLQQVRRIHRAARRRARADHGVDLVDEQDRVLVLLDLLHHLLQALLEIAAIARAGEQRAHVEREDRRARRALPALRP